MRHVSECSCLGHPIPGFTPTHYRTYRCGFVGGWMGGKLRDIFSLKNNCFIKIFSSKTISKMRHVSECSM